MTTILATFMIALLLSLVLTPLAGRLGTRFGAIDMPGGRKVHSKPIPRCGGMAIFLAFILTLFISTLFMTEVSNKLILEKKTVFFLIGILIVFAVGLFDDFHRLSPRVKFFFQVIVASVAFYGVLRIEVFSIFGVGLHFGILSYLVTVFWFVLFINAVNLIDGLDGLAAGIAFFTAMVLVILSVLRGEYLIGMLFAVLSGACLGFLRYNFNPASIFMGDGGSYFLGYAIAGLSIMGSIKSQVGAAMLIPVLALGIPLFDTILSLIRRFVRGRKMFHPDKGYVHHRLVEMGLTAKKVVWIIYATTFCLCIVAILVVNIRDERAGLFLIVLGAGAVVFVRKLGYFEYFASDKLYGWFKDVTDEAGFSHDRRSFLNLQIEIGQSRDLKELWINVCRALEKLKFDMAELDVKKTGFRDRRSGVGAREGTEV
jgi:UDP-GlcNAc:undecaprenyl-phosphate GlcNAc-1-phosphate transferase